MKKKFFPSILLVVLVFSWGSVFSQITSAGKVEATARAVVNMAELALQEARKAVPSGEWRGQVTPNVGPKTGGKEPAGTLIVPPGTMRTEEALPLVPSPSPSTNFSAMEDIPRVGTTDITIPPDTYGAVGLTKVMSTMNNKLSFNLKANTINITL